MFLIKQLEMVLGT